MTMFQKMLILSFVFCAWASFAAAQDYLKICSAIAPKEIAGSYLDGLLEGTTQLKSGRAVKWGLMYDKKELKPMIMTFVCPDDVNKEEFDAVIKTIVGVEFWKSITPFLVEKEKFADIEGISKLQQIALSDCIKIEIKADCTKTEVKSACWTINK